MFQHPKLIQILNKLEIVESYLSIVDTMHEGNPLHKMKTMPLTGEGMRAFPLTSTILLIFLFTKLLEILTRKN